MRRTAQHAESRLYRLSGFTTHSRPHPPSLCSLPLTLRHNGAPWTCMTCLFHVHHTSVACVNTHAIHMCCMCTRCAELYLQSISCVTAAVPVTRNTSVFQVYCMSSGCLQSGGGVQRAGRRASCLRGLRGRCASSGWPASTPR